MTPTLGADLLVVSWPGSTGWPRNGSACRWRFAQARLLSTIEDQGATRISDLAALDHCSQPTMTTQVAPPKTRAWYPRTVDPDDARAVLIRITRKASRRPGESAWTAARPSTRIWSGSTPHDRQTLSDAVRVLRRPARGRGRHPPHLTEQIEARSALECGANPPPVRQLMPAPSRTPGTGGPDPG